MNNNYTKYFKVTDIPQHHTFNFSEASCKQCIKCVWISQQHMNNENLKKIPSAPLCLCGGGGGGGCGGGGGGGGDVPSHLF